MTFLSPSPGPSLGPSSSRETSRVFVVGTCLIFALLWFATLGSYQLLDPDEGRYAEIPREMAVSGDWVTPRLNGIKYFEKPPLQYWATATAFSIFGAEVWSARLWVALTGFLGILLTGWLGRKLYDRRVGLMAATIQAGSMIYAALGHINTLDMGLSLSLQIALLGLVLLVEQKRLQGNWHASMLLAVGLTLAFLSKGLVGVVIPTAVAGIYVLLSRDWKLILRARTGWVLIVLVAVVSPWIYSVSTHNPEFLRFFFIHEHFERFVSRVHDRYQPAWFFIPVMLIGFMPWTPMLPKMIGDCWRSYRGGDRVTLLLSIWIMFVLAFFSLSQSKLIPYILPIFPALALLTGRMLAALPAKNVVRYLRLASAVWLMIAVIAALLHATTPLLDVKVGAAAWGLILAFVLAGLGVAMAAVVARHGKIMLAVCISAFSTLLLTSLVLINAQHLPRMQVPHAVAKQLQQHVTPSTAIYCVDEYWQSVTFYLERTCRLVGYRGEFDFGLQHEPENWIPDLAQFSVLWSDSAEGLATMRVESYHHLLKAGLPMRVLFSNNRVVVVSRH